MARGFLYLVAIMDWSSRKVLSYRISNTMESDFCVEALQEALGRYGKPEIFNADQGAQFTSEGFTGGIKRSRDIDQHGWERTLGRQCFCGAAVA